MVIITISPLRWTGASFISPSCDQPPDASIASLMFTLALSSVSAHQQAHMTAGR